MLILLRQMSLKEEGLMDGSVLKEKNWFLPHVEAGTNSSLLL
jgi:hypothetical protein